MLCCAVNGLKIQLKKNSPAICVTVASVLLPACVTGSAIHKQER